MSTNYCQEQINLKHGMIYRSSGRSGVGPDCRPDDGERRLARCSVRLLAFESAVSRPGRQSVTDSAYPVRPFLTLCGRLRVSGESVRGASFGSFRGSFLGS